MKSIYPLISFNSPSQIWQETPANLLIEIQFFALFFLCTYDAFIRQINRMYRIAWFMSLFSGILIELLTILPHTIGNFYHSQFVIMILGNREPLYMLPCLYVWFLYTFTTSIWSMNWQTKLSEYAFTVVVTYFIWQPLDLIGIHFQFWTWHNDEWLYEERNGGVPVASTFWMCSFMGGLQLTLRLLRDEIFLKNRRNLYRDISLVECIFEAAMGSILNLCVFMVSPFCIFYHPLRIFASWQFGEEHPCDFALSGFFLVCLYYVLHQVYCKREFIAIRVNQNILYTFLLQVVGIYIIGSCVMMHYVPIEGTKQVSFHQEMVLSGDQMREESFFGVFERNKYVVAEKIEMSRDHYSLDCYDYFKGEGVIEWYGLCLTGLEPEWIYYWYKLMFGSFWVMLLTQFMVFTHINQSMQKPKKDK